MTARLLDSDDPTVAAAWADLLGRSAAPPHASLPFVQAVAAEIGARVRVLAVESDPNDAPDPSALPASRAPRPFSAGLLVCEKRRGPWRCAVQPPLGYYHAPVVATPPRPSDVEGRATALDALAVALTTHFDAAALILPPCEDGALPDARTLTWHGFTCEVRYSYHLPLGPPDMLRRGMRPHTRRLLPPAPDPLTPGDPEVLAARVTASYARHGRRPPLSEAALARVARACVDGRAGHLYATAEADALLLGGGSDVPFDALSGSAPDHHARFVWSLGIALQDRGVRTLDLGGANTPSIANHKRRLGARLVPFVRATWHRPGLARLVAAVRPLV